MSELFSVKELKNKICVTINKKKQVSYIKTI